MTGFSKPSNPSKPFFLGVAGGSGSGKTHFARALQQRLGANACEIIYQDNFYFDHSQKFDKDGGAVNFDHPSAIEFSLLAKHMIKLEEGLETEIPIYDFVTHSRQTKTVLVEPKNVIIVDGILIAHIPEVRALFDELIFFDAPEELRFSRRLERDLKERGRKKEGVQAQFFKQVKPMHDEFVEPSKKHADRVVSDSENFNDLIESYFLKLNKKEK